MSYRALCEALLKGEPYAGSALQALQGDPERQRYFRPVVKSAAELLSSPLDILEIGCWAGVSTISWGMALRDLQIEGTITCVDPWLPYFDTHVNKADVYREMNEAADTNLIYKLFEHNIASAGLQNLVRIEKGTSREVLPKLTPSRWAIAYIDGSHTYADVAFDIDQARRLLRNGGILCGDDLELESEQIDPSELSAAVRTNQDFVLSASNGRYYHPGVTAAVGELIGKVLVRDGFWAVRIFKDRHSQLELDLASTTVPSHILKFAKKHEGQAPGYDLYSQGAHYFAVSRTVPATVVDELLGRHEMPPLTFRADTLQQVTEKLQASTKKASPEPDETFNEMLEPRIVDVHRGFNIVKFKRTVYGLRQSIGDVDVTFGEDSLLRRYSHRDVVVGTAVDAVKARIDNLETTEEILRVITDLRSEVGAELNAVKARIDNLETPEEMQGLIGGLRSEVGSELMKIGAELAHHQHETDALSMNLREQCSEFQRQSQQTALEHEDVRLKINQLSENVNVVTNQRLSRVESDVAKIYQSRIWRTLVRVGGLLNTVLGTNSNAGR